MRCAWEGESFPDWQFRPYRGRIKLHLVEPPHLSNGELPDQRVDMGAGWHAGPIGRVDYTDAADEAPTDEAGGHDRGGER